MARIEPAKRTLAAGAVLAGTAVALGAFGTHALRSLFSAEQFGWWQTGVQYQMWHGLALVALGAAGAGGRWPPRLMGGGTIVFAATLYAMALGAPRWLGAVTPVGGALMIAGWVCLLLGAIRHDPGASG
jgi:uncharacterized membrane protein YgdD (TMEM256/DUF423 family)